MTTGEELRDEGMARVLANEGPGQWRAAVDRIITSLIRHGEPFTSDDIHARLDELGLVAHHPNALPSIIGGVAKAGRIQRAGLVKTTRQSGHARMVTQWVPTGAVVDSQVSCTGMLPPDEPDEPEVVDDSPRNSTERIEELEAALDEVGQFLLDVQVNGGKVNRSELRGVIRGIRQHIELLG